MRYDDAGGLTEAGSRRGSRFGAGRPLVPPGPVLSDARLARLRERLEQSLTAAGAWICSPAKAARRLLIAAQPWLRVYRLPGLSLPKP